MHIKNLIHKYREIPTAVKAAVAFTISSFVLRGIAFITTPVFTRIMTQAQYGVVTIYNSWYVIVEVFALLGLTSAGIFNTGLNDYRDCRDKYISSILLLCNLTTVITFAILFGVRFFFCADWMPPGNLLLLMFITFIFSPAQVFWVTRQRYEYKYKLATVITICSAVLTQAAAVFLVLRSPEEAAAEVKLWSGGLAALLIYIPLYVYLFIRGRTGFDRSIWKQTLLFALPLLPHYLAQHVMVGADRIMIADMVSRADAAIYGVISAISTIATYIWNAVNASLVPFAYDKLNKKKYNELDKVVAELIAGYAVVCVAVTLIAPEVLVILAPAEYASGIYAVPPIVGYSFLSALYNIYANIEFYHKKASAITAATITACAVNLALNAVLIPRYGFVAAAYTTLVSNVVLIAMHYIGYRKCQPERVYNDRRLLGIGVLTILTCELCSLLYLSTIVRYAAIGLVAAVCVWKRKFIIDRLKQLQNR